MEVQLSKTINAPVEKVFDVFSDITQIENRIKGITKVEILSDVKSGVGTRWRETRVMFGRQATEEMEISALEANRSYDVVAESRGMKYHTNYTFTPQGDGTHVEMVFSGQPVSIMAKLMTPLAYLMKGTIRKAMDKDMDELKAVCEDGSA
jgi:carbon monoxide dehydrogenase subunit G